MQTIKDIDISKWDLSKVCKVDDFFDIDVLKELKERCYNGEQISDDVILLTVSKYEIQ